MASEAKGELSRVLGLQLDWFHWDSLDLRLLSLLMLRRSVSSFVQGLESSLPSLSRDPTRVRLPFVVLTPKGLGVPECQLTHVPL